MTLGQLFDQPILATEPEAENKLHYWAALNFVQVDFHEPFFYAHRVVTQEKYWTQLKGTPVYPKASGFYGQGTVHPLLDGERIFQVRLGMPADPAKTQEAAAALRFKGNILRSFLLGPEKKSTSTLAIRLAPNSM